MKTRLVLLVLALFSLGACETYGDRLDQLLFTNTERDLVAIWGPPSRVYELDEDRYLTWRNENQGS